MNEKTVNWDDLRLFMAVARAGGLAAAENHSGKSAPTLGRRMLALEAHLKQELFVRHSTGYELSAAGQELFEKLADLEAQLFPLLTPTTNKDFAPVKLSAGNWVTYYLCQQVKFWPEHKRIPLQFIAAEHVLDIGHREAVIGIRNKRPDQNNLACQPLNWVQFATYAVNKDVTTWAQVLNNTPSARWVSTQATDSASIKVTHPRNALDLAISGSCKTVLPMFIGETINALVKVSGEIDELKHRQWLVTHHDDRHKPEVRDVINWLKATLGGSEIL